MFFFFLFRFFLVYLTTSGFIVKRVPKYVPYHNFFKIFFFLFLYYYIFIVFFFLDLCEVSLVHMVKKSGPKRSRLFFLMRNTGKKMMVRITRSYDINLISYNVFFCCCKRKNTKLIWKLWVSFVIVYIKITISFSAI